MVALVQMVHQENQEREVWMEIQDFLERQDLL